MNTSRLDAEYRSLDTDALSSEEFDALDRYISRRPENGDGFLLQQAIERQRPGKYRDALFTEIELLTEENRRLKGTAS